MSRAYLLSLMKREDRLALRNFLISAAVILAVTVAFALWGPQ